MSLFYPSRFSAAAPASAPILQKRNMPSSRKDFLNKLYIALKECAETLYWLELLLEYGALTAPQYHSLESDCEELRKLLSSATKTLRSSDF